MSESGIAGHLRWVPLLLAVTLAVAPDSTARQTADPPDRMAGRLFVRGMTRAFLGDDPGAVALYREALTHTPDDPAILEAMAEAHARMGETDSALFYARRVAQLAPDRPGPGLVVARLLVASGAVPEALGVLDDLQARFPDDEVVLRTRADLLARTEQRTRARSAYRELVDRFGGSSDDLERLLDLETALGDLEAAVRLLERLERHRPGDAALLQRRAEILVQLGRTDDALGVFRQVLAADPASAEAREALRALEAGDDAAPLPEPERSGRHWLDAAASDPRNVDAWRAAVCTLAREGRTADALRAAEDGLLFFPGDPELELCTGTAALLAVLPDQAGDRFDEAVAVLSERAEADPGLRLGALAGRSAAAALSGTDLPLPDAVRETLQAGRLPAAARALTAFAIAREDPSRALGLADDAVDADGGDAVAIAARALALHALGRSAEAGREAEGPASDPEAPPLVLLVAGDLAFSAGRTSAAQEFWERALTRSPASGILRARLEKP